MYKRLDRLYCQDITTMIDTPPLSCGVELPTSFDVDTFRLKMFSAYKTLDNKLKSSKTVSLDEIKCIGCRYNLTTTDLYNNMRRIDNYVKEKN